jgi:hypothetical protein
MEKRRLNVEMEKRRETLLQPGFLRAGLRGF